MVVIACCFSELKIWKKIPVCMFIFLVDNMQFLCENSVGNACCSLSCKSEEKKISVFMIYFLVE